MSEYRQDPLTGRWVVIGRQRAGRPEEFVEHSVARVDFPCPFCPGHESETPPAVLEWPADHSGEWSLRVVPNRFPAVGPHSAPVDDFWPSQEQPGWDEPRQNGSHHPAPNSAGGVHEVVIESRRHVGSLSELTPVECERVIAAYQSRLTALQATAGVRYVQIFKNVGPAAGATLAHAHSQIVGLPFVPDDVRSAWERSLAYFAKTGRSLLSELVHRELESSSRVVARSPRFVAFCPWASRFPYSVCIAPLAPGAFEDAQATPSGELAAFAQELVGRIESALGRPAYNLVLHLNPFDSGHRQHYHWRMELIPRLTKIAGFEWGTGMMINPYPPEAAAELLRSQAVAPAR